MDLSSFSTLSIEQQDAAIQDHVDRKIAAAAAAAQEEAFVTHAIEEANKERAQAQDKEPRSSDDSSHANPIVQGIAKALQGLQVQQQQQAAANSQAGWRSNESWPCGTLRNSTTFPGRRLHRHSQHRRQRQPSVAGGCSLGCCLFQPLRYQGKHRVKGTVRGVLLATAGAATSTVFSAWHDARSAWH